MAGGACRPRPLRAPPDHGLLDPARDRHRRGAACGDCRACSAGAATGHRRNLLRRLEQERGSRVITLIHRQEGSGLLGLAFGRYIDIDDSEQLLRAIRLTPHEMPIDLLLHTPGGLVLASDQIAYALKRHDGKVTVIVPHYAMSGGTLVALAADEILMDPDAVLGPVDPQLGSLPRGSWPAASILKALRAGQPQPRRRDAHPRRRRAQGDRPGARHRARNCSPDASTTRRRSGSRPCSARAAGRTTTRSGWRRRGRSGCPSPTPCPSSSTS